MPRTALLLPFALVAVPAVLLAGVIFFVVIGAPTVLAVQPRPAPVEPLLFDHSLHTNVVGIDCQFCHRTVATAGTAGYPDVEQCMFCHQTIGAGRAEAEKVRTAWVQQQPINWERIHRMPDHVKFTHANHINAGIDCAECHGDVRQMQQVVQVRSLLMGDCVDCHRKNQASTECFACHY